MAYYIIFVLGASLGSVVTLLYQNYRELKRAEAEMDERFRQADERIRRGGRHTSGRIL